MKEIPEGFYKEEVESFGKLEFQVDYSLSPIATPYIEDIIAASEEYVRRSDYIEQFSHEIGNHPKFSDRTYLIYMGRTALTRLDYPRLSSHLNGLEGSISRALVGKAPATKARFRRIKSEIWEPTHSSR